MKRVLIITYYWPPSGGAGVQRWLKFAKYLPQYGWQPVIFTPENPEAPVLDDSLLKDIPEEVEVIKNKVWEPYNFYKFFLGKTKKEKIQTGFISESGQQSRLKENIAVWVRGNLFIPDARRFWIRPSVKLLSKYLSENHIDAIVSTGPPHSTHLIALGLKKKFPRIPWIADFRDPWTNIDFYKELKLTHWADKKHRKLEKKVLQQANKVVTVSRSWGKELEALGAKQVAVITNGYDETDFEEQAVAKTNKISIAHIGSISPNRNPVIFWDALSMLEKKLGIKQLNESLEIHLIGNVDHSVKQTVEYLNLQSVVSYPGHISHNEVAAYQQKAHYLLLAINDAPNAKGVLPGKIFEYIASGTPIIGVGPEDGDAAVILNDTGAGIMFNDAQQLYLYLYNCLNGTAEVKQRNDAIIAGFSRNCLTEKMVNLFEQFETT